MFKLHTYTHTDAQTQTDRQTETLSITKESVRSQENLENDPRGTKQPHNFLAHVFRSPFL